MIRVRTLLELESYIMARKVNVTFRVSVEVLYQGQGHEVSFGV